MFDIGWMELLLIGIVALIVVGPKELPVMFRTVGRYMGKARAMAREFQRSMEQAADESGLNEAARGLQGIDRLNVRSPGKMARTYAKSVVTGDEDKPADAAKAGADAAADPASAGAERPAAGPAAQPEAPAGADADRSTT